MGTCPLTPDGLDFGANSYALPDLPPVVSLKTVSWESRYDKLEADSFARVLDALPNAVNVQLLPDQGSRFWDSARYTDFCQTLKQLKGSHWAASHSWTFCG